MSYLRIRGLTVTIRFIVDLIAADENDPSRDIVITKTVMASSWDEALSKAREAAKQENPGFNVLRADCWNTEQPASEDIS